MYYLHLGDCTGKSEYALPNPICTSLCDFLDDTPLEESKG
jgi:hypothetical protein